MYARHHFIPRALAAAALALVCCGAGAAGGSGTYSSNGKSVALVDAYACTEPDMLNEGKLVTIVAFADGAIDKAAANAEEEHCRAVLHQHGKKFPTLVELKIKYDGSFYNVQTFDASGSVSRSDGTLKLTRNDGRRVEGSYVSKRFDLRFALDVAGGQTK